MPISLKANSDGSAEILNGVKTAITISPNGNVKASGMQGYNYIINGNFDIWQRGTSQTNSGYGSDDRWFNGASGTTIVHSKQPFAVGETFPDGHICPANYSRTVVSSVVGVNNVGVKYQKIEYVKTLAGRKASLSFYGKANAAKTIAIEFVQTFGAVGSPSSDVLGIGVQKIALTTVWQRFVVVVDIPSISGKVLGTDGTDSLHVAFWFDAGSNLNARTNSLGHQSGTFDIACVSLVEGDIDVKPMPRSYGEELALCQRYYWRGHENSIFNQFTTATGQSASWQICFPIEMRVAPTVSFLGITTSHFGQALFSFPSKLGARLLALNSQVAASDAHITIPIGGYLEADAEL